MTRIEIWDEWRNGSGVTGVDVEWKQRDVGLDKIGRIESSRVEYNKKSKIEQWHVLMTK